MFVAASAAAAVRDGGICNQPRRKLFDIRRSSAQMTTAMFSGLVHAVRLIIGLCDPAMHLANSNNAPCSVGDL